MIAEIDRAREARRHAWAAVRGHRHRRADRPWQLRAVGSQARRPARAGADVDPGDQGGRHRHRPRGRGAARLARPRRDRARRRRRRRLPFARPTNNAGGLEGGVTNGEDVRVSAWMKPISTLMKPLRSVDLTTLTEVAGARSSAATSAPFPPPPSSARRWWRWCSPTRCVENFGGDSLAELRRSIDAWTESASVARERRRVRARRRIAECSRRRRTRHDAPADPPLR